MRNITKVLTAVAVLAATLGSAASPAAAVTDNPDLDTAGDYVYVVNTEAGTIDVTISLAVTADVPNRSSAAGVYQYYFAGTTIVIPKGVENLAVTDDSGRVLEFTLDEGQEYATILDIAFRRNIYYRRTANTVISFSLPQGEAGSDSVSRVNGAYVGFQAWTDPRLEEATVTIVAPEGFESQSLAATGLKRQTGGTGEDVRLEALNVDPENYWTFVSLTREEALVASEFDVDEHAITLEAWPGDQAWSKDIQSTLEEGLPELERSIGLDWPIDGTLTITESFSPFLSGYGGWYDSNTDQIEVGDDPDSQLIFHELSHVWFNDSLFNLRWITEGLADEFAAETVEAGGDKRPEPPRISLLDEAAKPLNRWSTTDFGDESEQWSYGASWTVTHEIAQEIGIDNLSLVLQAASAGDIPYLGDGSEPEQAEVDKSWRRYLDLIENRGNMQDNDITELFEEWVLTDSEANQLEDRAAARLRYDELVTQGGEWAAPLGVRVAMSEWKFGTATELMDEATAVLVQRDELVAQLDDLDATISSDLEGVYESGESDLTEVAALLTEATAAVENLQETKETIAAADGFVQKIGLLGEDLDAPFADAVSTLSDGDYDEANDQASALNSQIDELASTGTKRIGGVLGGIVVVLIGLTVLVRRRKRKKQAGTEAGTESAEVIDDDPSDGGFETEEPEGDNPPDGARNDIDELAGV